VSKAEKQLERLRRNPQGDWTIEDLKRVAEQFNVRFREGKGSHLVFEFPGGIGLTVPRHRPVKPVYIRRFCELIKEEAMS
jgi:hypothetical protein